MTESAALSPRTMIGEEPRLLQASLLLDRRILPGAFDRPNVLFFQQQVFSIRLGKHAFDSRLDSFRFLHSTVADESPKIPRARKTAATNRRLTRLFN